MEEDYKTKILSKIPVDKEEEVIYHALEELLGRPVVAFDLEKLTKLKTRNLSKGQYYLLYDDECFGVVTVQELVPYGEKVFFSARKKTSIRVF